MAAHLFKVAANAGHGVVMAGRQPLQPQARRRQHARRQVNFSPVGEIVFGRRQGNGGRHVQGAAGLPPGRAQVHALAERIDDLNAQYLQEAGAQRSKVILREQARGNRLYTVEAKAIPVVPVILHGRAGHRLGDAVARPFCQILQR